MAFEVEIQDADWEIIKSTITGLLNQFKLSEEGGTDDAKSDIEMVETYLARNRPLKRKSFVFRIANTIPELLRNYITDKEDPPEVVSDNLTIESKFRQIHIANYPLSMEWVTHEFKSHCTNRDCKKMGQEILEYVPEDDIQDIEDEIGLEMCCYDCDKTWLVNWETGERLPRCRCCDEEIDDPSVLEEINRGKYISHCSECSGYHCEFCARDISERTCTECIDEKYHRDEYLSENFSQSAERTVLGHRKGGRDIYDTRDI